MKRTILVLILLAIFLINISYAQQSYMPIYPSYSMELTKSGSNNPTGNLFTYQGSNGPVYQVGKINDAPTYKRAFYQWNITSNDIPFVAVIDSVVISFDLQF